MNFFTASPTFVKWLLRFWPPFWFTGIRFEHISSDFRSIRTSMPLRFYNQNLHGYQFGGSLFSMTDPCYLMIIWRNLGRDYRVLDQSAQIEFLKPGTKQVYADFHLSDEDLADIRQQTMHGEKYLKEFCVDIFDLDQLHVARVKRVVYIRKARQ